MTPSNLNPCKYSFIMLYLVHETDIDYLVVDDMINIKIV
jgi:hypothetical protein